MGYNLYKYLGLSKISEDLYISLNDSIKKNYNIIGDINLYTPNFELLALNTEDKMFNHTHKLIKLLKKKHRIDTHGFLYKALIKFKSKKYYKQLFIKEIPIISIKSDLSMDPNILSHKQFAIYNQLYNKNSPANIEVFVSYIISRISELNISPTFCKIYGCFMVNMFKYTYIEDSDKSPLSLIKWKKNIKYSDHDDLYIEKREVPVYLLALEKTDYDIDFIKSINENIDITTLKTLLFQVFAAIFAIYNLFGIKHNDLHIGNIMLTNTDIEFLYYQSDEHFYKVPTYGFLIKIIDWGRATYKFNSNEGKNTIFNRGEMCNGQYQYTMPNKPSLGYYYKNKWSDIVLISHSLLHNFPDISTYPLIYKLLRNNIKTKKGPFVTTKDFNWDVYEFIGNSSFTIRPRTILSHKIFKSYKIDSNNIPNKQHIYKIVL